MEVKMQMEMINVNSKNELNELLIKYSETDLLSLWLDNPSDIGKDSECTLDVGSLSQTMLEEAFAETKEKIGDNSKLPLKCLQVYLKHSSLEFNQNLCLQLPIISHIPCLRNHASYLFWKMQSWDIIPKIELPEHILITDIVDYCDLKKSFQKQSLNSQLLLDILKTFVYIIMSSCYDPQSPLPFLLVHNESIHPYQSKDEKQDFLHKGIDIFGGIPLLKVILNQLRIKSKDVFKDLSDTTELSVYPQSRDFLCKMFGLNSVLFNILWETNEYPVSLTESAAKQIIEQTKKMLNISDGL